MFYRFLNRKNDLLPENRLAFSLFLRAISYQLIAKGFILR
jgi:hypothetical protein